MGNKAFPPFSGIKCCRRKRGKFCQIDIYPEKLEGVISPFSIATEVI